MKKVENLIKHIGAKIKYYRNLNKISLSQLSNDAGISKSTLFGLEEGRSNPTISTLVNIARTLNINLNELIGNTNDNLQSSKLSLISKDNINNYSLYRLNLSPFEVFELDSYINSVSISVLNGEVCLVDKSVILFSNDTIITDNRVFKALSSGVTATVKIYNNHNILYTNRDILKKSATKEILDNIYKNSINELITRVIFKTIAPIEELNKIKYVNYIESLEEKESHYYFYRKYFGLNGRLKQLLLKLNCNLKEMESLEKFINKATNSNQLSYNDLKILKNDVINESKEILGKCIEKKYQNIIKIESIYELLNKDNHTNKSYYLITDLIDSKSDKLNNSLLINIYRILERVENIKESELNNTELTLQSRLLSTLTKALYYAYCKHSSFAINYLKESLLSLDDIEIENSIIIDRYLQLQNIIKTTIKNFNNNYTLDEINTIENIVADLGFEIELKELISPVIDNCGLYCYIFKK